MPKMKTHKSSAKCYKVSATGKVMRSQCGRGHLNSKKSAARKRRLEGAVEIYSGYKEIVAIEIPYPQYLR